MCKTPTTSVPLKISNPACADGDAAAALVQQTGREGEGKWRNCNFT